MDQNEVSVELKEFNKDGVASDATSIVNEDKTPVSGYAETEQMFSPVESNNNKNNNNNNNNSTAKKQNAKKRPLFKFSKSKKDELTAAQAKINADAHHHVDQHGDIRIKPETLGFVILFIALQLLSLVLFAIFADYPDVVRHDDGDDGVAHQAEATHEVHTYYKALIDVTIMIFIGFGFLMTFLKKASFTAVGMNMMIAAFAYQIVILLEGFWLNVHAKPAFSKTITIDFHALIEGNFGAGAVLISFGAVLGKISPTQLLMMAVSECFFYTLNWFICYLKLDLVDIGGSMIIHTFGAYFGLSCSWILTTGPAREDADKNNKSRYTTDIIAMIGTIFLWIMWPSFNGALATNGSLQFRSIINTIFGLLASACSTFIFSRLFRKKFEMVDIQNATLAGGVAMGASANLNIHPAGAIAIGLVAGFISVVGFVYLTPLLCDKLKLHDVCGIHNLHGMPGVLGAIASMIAIAAYPQDWYARGSNQAKFSLACLAITLGIAIGSGLLTGLLLRWVMPNKNFYRDDETWHVPDDYTFQTDAWKALEQGGSHDDDDEDNKAH